LWFQIGPRVFQLIDTRQKPTSKLNLFLDRQVRVIGLIDYRTAYHFAQLVEIVRLPLGLEGIVAKRRDQPYKSGRSPDWVKVKNSHAPAASTVIEG
jgi:ATP-dependent DNA ligase